MRQNKRLMKNIVRAWQNTITNHYQEHSINSESGLQACFCAKLLEVFYEANRSYKIFIEPQVYGQDANEHIRPNIVISRRKQILVVIDLKYKPHARPNYSNNMQTLEWVLAHHSILSISNSHFLGVGKENNLYSLSDDVLLCWAGIYRGEQVHIRDYASDNLCEHLLELHALTSQGQHPIITSVPAIDEEEHL